MSTRKRNTITTKQKALIREIRKDPTATMKDLMLRAGYSETCAHNPGAKLSYGCKSLLEKELQKLNVDDAEVAKKIKEGINAFSIKSHYDPDKGLFVEDAPRVDFSNRHKYIETLMKFRELLKDLVEHSGTIGFTPVPLDEKRETHLDAELGTVFKKKRK